jgi:hypothetical protein
MATLMVTIFILLALGILTHFVPGMQKGRVGRPSSTQARPTKRRTMRVPGTSNNARPSTSVPSGPTMREIGGRRYAETSSCSLS